MNPDLGPPFTRTQAQTRATFIRTSDGRRVVVRNGELLTDTVVVHRAFAIRRLSASAPRGAESE